MRLAYGVAGRELLLRSNDGSGPLGCVQSGFAADDGLALSGAASGFGADFCNGVPVVRHDGGFAGVLNCSCGGNSGVGG